MITDGFDPSEHADDDDRAAAWDPTIGTGTPETAALEDIDVPWLRRQPLLALILAVQLPVLGAFVTELATDATPAVAILLGSIVGLLALGGRVAWNHVTPTARPRLAPDIPLTPPAAPPPG